ISCHLAPSYRQVFFGENVQRSSEIRSVYFFFLRGDFHYAGIDTYWWLIIANGIAKVLAQTHFIAAFLFATVIVSTTATACTRP
ncbi:MAG TPA: hypothetical protein DDZ53_02070, partial [Firmicutes bacterium]|nr:hypothetical protein [Bacillota bacterium]